MNIWSLTSSTYLKLFSALSNKGWTPLYNTCNVWHRTEEDYKKNYEDYLITYYHHKCIRVVT